MIVTVFQKTILDWYKKNGRHSLPWRYPALKFQKKGVLDPYKILVSELMLQQTQVDRVILKFTSFLKAFPTFDALANASTSTLLFEWKGLGYNRRALYLQRAACIIRDEYRGVFPRDPELIERLPGVGHYTARAVAVFSFNTPHVFIETNIRRVFLHHFFEGKTGVSDEQILSVVAKALWISDPRKWYGALMDYGALGLRDIPNPNTRSKHYARQSRFEGSTRHARATILNFVLQSNGGVSFPSIQKHLAKNSELSRYSEKTLSKGFCSL